MLMIPFMSDTTFLMYEVEKMVTIKNQDVKIILLTSKWKPVGTFSDQF